MHFINLKGFSKEELELILDRALTVKQNQAKFSSALLGKKMYMLFEKTSTRTALSFGLGMYELGGTYFLQNWEDSNFSIGEIQDEVRYVGRNVDIIMARLKLNESINLMAKYSTVPVINGCCNRYHPCQAMGDLLTIKETFGHYNVKLLYIGVLNNVFNSLAASLPKLGGELIAITPLINQPSLDQELLEAANNNGRFTAVDCEHLTEKALKEIVSEVDIVYTDTWVDMEFFNNQHFSEAKQQRINKMLPFQLNNELLAGTKAKVMHDMPIHPGYEITREIVENHIDFILQQAENRRHAEKAILLTLLEDEKVRALFGE
jgi:ornithine carbamoyltransferase